VPFRVDLHVHTRRHSDCAQLLAPEGLGAAAAGGGVHGVVLAEHDVLWDPAELEALEERLQPLRIYRAIEVTTTAGHLIVIGLPAAPPGLRGIDPERLVDLAQAARAAVILPHPHRLTDLARLLAKAAVRRGITAVEVASSVTRAEASRSAMALCRELGALPVGGSDAHAPEVVGAAFTWLPDLPPDAAALAAALRAGLGRPGRAGEP
jgi:hypothetical protein